LVRDEGDEALSMRRIAQDLDVWPMSLYRYYHDKDALLDALAEEAASSINLPSSRVSARRQLHQLLVAIEAVLEDHPGGKHLRLIGPQQHPAAAPVNERALAIIAQLGLDESTAGAAWHALVLYAAGAAAAGASDEFASGLDLFLDGLEANASSSQATETTAVSL
jgi:AcrR family transcriptional regulator